MSHRWTLHHVYRLSAKENIDLDHYRELKHKHALVEENLDRLEDELQVCCNEFKNISKYFFSQLLLTDEITSVEEERVKENDSFLDF